MSDHTDFEASNHGSIVLLKPLSESAMSWVENHFPEDALMLAGRYAIELRYAPPIFEWIEADGLTIA